MAEPRARIAGPTQTAAQPRPRGVIVAPPIVVVPPIVAPPVVVPPVVVPPAPTLPMAPTTLSATAASTTGITITWVDTSNNELGFKVVRAQGAGAFNALTTVGANITSFADVNLAPSTAYSYRVCATNAVGDSAFSPAATATTHTPAPVIPAAPTGVTATPGNGTVTVSWTPSIGPGVVTQIRVYRTTVPGTYTTPLAAGVLPPDRTSFVDNTVVNLTTYFYVVTAVTALESPKSVQVSAMPFNAIVNAPYSPFNYDYGVTFMANHATKGPLNAGDDYNEATAYGPAHVSGNPHQGWVSTADLTKTDYTQGLFFPTLALDVKIAGSNNIANTGAQREFRMNLVDPLYPPDPDGKRRVAILVALGKANASGALNYAELRDGATVLAKRDGAAGIAANTEFTRFVGLDPAVGYGGAAMKGFPEEMISASLGPTIFNGWVNGVTPEVFAFSSDFLSVVIGAPAARAGVSAIAYIRVRRVRQSQIPRKASWEHNMLRFGRFFYYCPLSQSAGALHSHGQSFPITAADIAAAPTGLARYKIASDVATWEHYYDALRIWIQIYKYTRDARDREMVEHCFDIAIPFLMQHQGGTPGAVVAFNNFTTGMRLYHDLVVEENGGETTKSLLARTCALAVANNAAYTEDFKWTSGNMAFYLNTANAQRENSYGLTAKVDAEALNDPLHAPTGRCPHNMKYVLNGLNHIKVICVDHTFVSTLSGFVGLFVAQPFMMANNLVGLIRWVEMMKETEPDGGQAALDLVLPSMKQALDFMWEYLWIPNMPNGIPTATSFVFAGVKTGNPNGASMPIVWNGTDTAPWLNLLVVQPWGWYYHQTGDTTYRDQGDAIFAGGAQPYVGTTNAWWAGGPKGKIYNQQMVKSFEYVMWREMTPLATPPVPSTGPVLLTDLTMRTEPELPVMGLKGSKVTDPVFGTEILRITDSSHGADLFVPYSTYVTFSKNNNWLYTQNGNAATFFDFNHVSFSATLLRTAPSPPSGNAQWYAMTWSGIVEQQIFLNGGVILWSYDILMNTYTNLRSFAVELAAAPADHLEQMTVSDDDDVFAFSYAESDGTHIGYLVWRRSTNTILRNTMDAGADEVHLDKTGGYLTIVQGTGGALNGSPQILNLATLGLTQLTAFDSGNGFYHSGWGTGTLFAGNGPTDGLGYRSLATPTTVVANLAGFFGFGNMNYSMHATNEKWALVWVQRDDTLTLTEPFENEILQVATDGTNRVRRICHHRSAWTVYEDQPNANISRDGKFVAFTSNWGNPGGRRDVYVVKISVAPAT